MKFKDIIKSILTEDSKSNDIDWLVNWLKKVPEEKLKKTFTSIDSKGKVKTMTRDEILKVLSDKSKIMFVTDPKEEERLGLNFGLGQFRPPHANAKPEDVKYFGKILISPNWKNIIKTEPQFKDVNFPRNPNPLGTVLNHERVHLLQYQQANYDKKEGKFKNEKTQWSKKISGFCKSSTSTFCKEATYFGFGYYERPEEIYAHLFSIREMLGIKPMDLVTYANARIRNKTVTINVSVYRGGKVIQLPTKTMNTESSTFVAIYCCNKSFKESLMYLNNTLASIENNNKVPGDDLA